jgi:hypothetical protein
MKYTEKMEEKIVTTHPFFYLLLFLARPNGRKLKRTLPFKSERVEDARCRMQDAGYSI